MDFEDFWKQYPRKINKKKSFVAWQRLTDIQKRAALEKIGAHVAYWRACNTEMEFIPHASTWLNGWRFEDELQMPTMERAVAWWATEKGVLDKGRELGIFPRPGEEMPQFKDRVIASMRRAA